MRNDMPVATLLENAACGMNSAWQEIVRRYASLVYAGCRRHGIGGADADDVAGNVWLRLLTNLDTIREPKALPGWLRTTTRRECLSLLRERHHEIPDEEEFPDLAAPPADASLLGTERRTAMLAAVRTLPERDRRLLALLYSDPPTPYTVISSRLGMPIGAIGPTRQRCLARVRRSAAIAALLIDDGHARTERAS